MPPNSRVVAVIAAEAQYRDLMLAGLGGDKAAYRRLLAQLGGHLRAYFARRTGADVEDLVQETLIAIHTKRATYDPTLPFTAWVHGIARYKLIDAFRRDKRRLTVALEDAPDLFAHDAAEASAARRDVEKLLATLPPKKRDLVRAVKLEGRSIAEEAKAAGLSESVVKVTVHRAVKLLGQELGGRHENG
jgi:RNA polymerase sigma-70 factor, ECF subfamily